MKLYATVTSERASKSQGGNRYLDVVFRVGDKRVNEIIGTVILTAEEGGWKLLFIDSDTPNSVPKELKGKKQKGEIKPIPLNSRKYKHLRKKDRGNW